MKSAMAAVIGIAVLVTAIWWYNRAPQAQFQRPPSVVNVVVPRSGNLDAEIHSVGTVQARASVLLTSEVDARLVKVLVEEGAKVRAGQKLARLDDRVARAELVRADARLKDAEAAWQRADQLKEAELLSPAEIDTLQADLLSARADRDAAAANLADHTIVAPFAGVTGLRRVNEGSFVKSGDALWTLDDLDHLEVIFAIPERYIGEVREGQEVSVTSRSYPDTQFLATVERIDTRVDSDNRTVSVKAALDNQARRLRPGQFLDVALRTGRREALMVPEQAIITEGRASYLYTVAENVASRVEVVTGQRLKGWVEIRSGLDAATSVVVNGHSRLGPGGPVDVRDDPEALMPETADAFQTLTAEP